MFIETKMRTGLGTERGLLIILLLLSANVLSAQSDSSADKSQISRLLTGLSDHSIKPTDVLDPSMDPKKRTSSLGYFEDPAYQLSLVPVGEIEITADGTASVLVKVLFKTESREVGGQSTVAFVKRNQVWYFANFSFLGFPTVIIAAIIVGALMAISYASAVLLLRRELLRQGKLDLVDRAKIFVPIFWPTLFSRTHRRSIGEISRLH
jgi:hypothetical protein